MKLIAEFKTLFEKKERKKILINFFLGIIITLLEFLGLGSIFIVISFFLNPQDNNFIIDFLSKNFFF